MRPTLRNRSHPLQAVGKTSDGHKGNLCLKMKVAFIGFWWDHTLIFVKGDRTTEKSTINEKGWGRKMMLTLLHISLQPDQEPQPSMLNYTTRAVDSQLLNLHVFSGLLDLFWLRETKLPSVIKVYSKFEFTS